MVHARELIPPLTLRTPQGRTVRAWDFKQKRNLVIAFLDASCPRCEAFVRTLASRAADLRENEAVALFVFAEIPSSVLHDSASPEIISGFDLGGHGRRLFLGEERLSACGLSRRGVFVTDRYGEISARWVVEGHGFPRIEEILSSLHLVEIACEECSVPHWPVDD
ncbi:MAG: peroxiredoxin family protein [Candidatus Acidiferrales bacterium]